MSLIEAAVVPDLRHALLERSPVPLAELEGPEHLVRYANPAFCRLVGKSKEEVLGRPFAESMQKGDRCLAVLDRIHRTGEPEAHTEAESAEACPAFWSYAAWPVLDEAARPTGVMIQVTETTLFHRQTGNLNEQLMLSAVRQHEFAEIAAKLNEQLRAEIAERCRLEKQAREQAEALADLDRRKDEFLAMLGHELRNPLAPLANAVHLLRLHNQEDQLQEHARSIIERQTAQLTRLVDELLEVGRITAGRIHLRHENVDLRGVVEHAVETARPRIDQKQHTLAVQLPPAPVWVNGDAARLEQVMVNLLTNACKYSADHVRIAVSLQSEEDGHWAVLRVRDQGVGIAPDVLPRVFELFTQADRSLDRSQGGLGIGLALVRRLVELHGGWVEALSSLGQGSEFVVHLPAAAAPTPQPQSAAAIVPPVRSLRVLVVDDNRDTAESLAAILRISGHDVRTASDGPEALQAALEYQPNVVLLDIGLPGLTGYEVAKQLRQQPALAHAVLVAMTGYGQESDRERSREAGIDHHFVKPADFEKLQEILAGVET